MKMLYAFVDGFAYRPDWDARYVQWEVPEKVGLFVNFDHRAFPVLQGEATPMIDGSLYFHGHGEFATSYARIKLLQTMPYLAVAYRLLPHRRAKLERVSLVDREPPWGPCSFKLFEAHDRDEEQVEWRSRCF